MYSMYFGMFGAWSRSTYYDMFDMFRSMEDLARKTYLRFKSYLMNRWRLWKLQPIIYGTRFMQTWVFRQNSILLQLNRWWSLLERLRV